MKENYTTKIKKNNAITGTGYSTTDNHGPGVVQRPPLPAREQALATGGPGVAGAARWTEGVY